MSGDGPTKVAPEVEPLDDIILGDDDGELTVSDAPRSVPPPVHAHASGHPSARPSASPPPEDRKSVRPSDRRSSDRVRAAADAKATKRSKLTLRIPDDEISRPQLPATTPAGGVSAVTVAAAARLEDDFESRLAADDTLELPGEEVRARMAAITNEVDPAPKAAGIDASHDPGWTPYQPPVDAHLAASGNGGVALAAAIQAPAEAHVPVASPSPTPERRPSTAPERRPSTMPERIPSTPPISEEIPVETDLESESETISFDEVTSQQIPVEEGKLNDGDRVTDPGEALEVSAEDLVSVESLPHPHRPPPVKTTTGKHPIPQGPVVAAQVTPAAAPVKVAPASSPAAVQAQPAQPIAQHSHAPQSPPVAAQPATLATPATQATPGTTGTTGQMAQVKPRPSSPQFIVPPGVGALAPPPMTDTAASRKKTRPWWEELFNDDYIRTMAKVNDSQIRAEVSFIEESLGCEAGAMILDLACGTGRHAVELATRGYQVVGFDLSLAMLARASDEAQERKQKINFVQGDMREMTFEETFDGVYAWNTSFGFFDEEKNAAVVAKVHRALKKGGQFLLDVVNRDYIVRQAPSLAWFEGDGCICMDEMQIDFITSRMRVKRTLMMDDGRTKEIEYSIRVYALHELGKMLHDNGFRVAEVSGRTGTPGVFFGCESPRTLILAEKR